MVFHAILNRRQFLQLAAAASTTAALLPAAPAASGAKRRRLIVDADTANEIDDAFALARALIEPSFQIEGITSAQWHTQEDAPPDTVGPSGSTRNCCLWSMRICGGWPRTGWPVKQPVTPFNPRRSSMKPGSG
jgi:hypothetical protein